MSVPLNLDDLPAPGHQRVLVAVLPTPADLTRAAEEGWYRVPVARAPAQMGADYLAFYQTGAFAPADRWQIATLAAVRRVSIARRVDLLPAEPQHPRAHDEYYRIELGPLWRLPQPIPSRRLRRITFIPTTLARLLSAREINDLWDKGTAQDRLWSALLNAGLEAERQAPWDEPPDDDVADLDDVWGVAETPGQPPIDFALYGRSGRVAVIYAADLAAPLPATVSPRSLREAGDQRYALAAAGWTPVFLDPEHCWRQPAACLREITQALAQVLDAKE